MEYSDEARAALFIEYVDSQGHLEGYWKEYMRDFPKRVGSLGGENPREFHIQVIQDFEAWKEDIDYTLKCGDDGAHGIVGCDLLRKRIFG